MTDFDVALRNLQWTPIALVSGAMWLWVAASSRFASAQAPPRDLEWRKLLSQGIACLLLISVVALQLRVAQIGSMGGALRTGAMLALIPFCATLASGLRQSTLQRRAATTGAFSVAFGTTVSGALLFLLQ